MQTSLDASKIISNSLPHIHLDKSRHLNFILGYIGGLQILIWSKGIVSHGHQLTCVIDVAKAARLPKRVRNNFS